jgi:segregation and condensation protein A
MSKNSYNTRMEENVATEFKIKSAVFEGPLELLLQLIEARKLHINDISLASVTDDYLSYMRNLPNQELGNVTAFLSVASTLILIKSKSLLPNLTLSHEEQTDINTLEHRLRLYQVVREAVEPLSKIYGLQIIFPAPERDFTSPVFSPDASLTKENMLLSIANVVNALPKPETPKPEVEIQKMMSIDEAISNLTERLSRATELSFKTLTNSEGKTPAEAKVFVIVSFLAMLELVRQGLLDVMQSNEFGDIQFIKNQEGIAPEQN